MIGCEVPFKCELSVKFLKLFLAAPLILLLLSLIIYVALVPTYDIAFDDSFYCLSIVVQL